MDLLQAILNAQGGGAVQKLADRFGLGEGETVSALQSLLPAIAGGMQRNVQQEGGLESLMGALMNGNHQRYVDEPEAIDPEAMREDGNGILGHLFGSKEVSRQVADHASAQTGLGSGLLKQMLPVVAAMAMGALSKQASGNSMAAAPPSGGGGILDMISPLLDQNRDGSSADDVLGFVSRMFLK
ncbi:MAG TPA: DUF937 domain-containing protein [Bryobacteraceae bacterium]|nr:DUF937 domain-containing protein [Bryobacteraceae bacterium]